MSACLCDPPDCNDGDICTTDYCLDGVCKNEPKCPAGQVCLGSGQCCPSEKIICEVSYSGTIGYAAAGTGNCYCGCNGDDSKCKECVQKCSQTGFCVPSGNKKCPKDGSCIDKDKK